LFDITMPSYRLDLHVHSPASQCFAGGPDGYDALIEEASKKCLDLIAVTDHHSARGVSKLQAIGKAQHINVLPGVELTCRIDDVNEVFLLALFPEEFDPDRIEELLRGWKVPAHSFGFGGFVLPVAVEEVVGGVAAAGGIVISTRADKTSYRRAAIPGLLRGGVYLFDLVFPESEQLIFSPMTHQASRSLHFFTFSDAHTATDVGERFSDVTLATPSFAALLEKIGQKR
jgi:hypothetical protein